jgi:hypothetical protein
MRLSMAIHYGIAQKDENSVSDQNKMPVTPFCEGVLSSELKQPEIVP